jgi:hypothetical protein
MEMEEEAQLAVVAKHSALPLDRLKYLPSATADVVHETNYGVIMILAFWSGTALMAFRKYTSILVSTPRAEELDVTVVNTDGIPELYNLPELKGRITGSCESVFIRAGTIVDSIVIYDEGAFKAALDRLLDAHLG